MYIYMYIYTYIHRQVCTYIRISNVTCCTIRVYQCNHFNVPCGLFIEACRILSTFRRIT